MVHDDFSLSSMDEIAIERKFFEAIRSLAICEDLLILGKISPDNVLVELLSTRCFFYEYNKKQLYVESK